MPGIFSRPAGDRRRGKLLRVNSALRLTSRGWQGDYSVETLSFVAPRAGLYRLRLRSAETKHGQILRYVIRQERTSPPAGKVLCFDAFGPQFMENVVSASLLQDKLRTLVPPADDFGPLRIMALATVEGQARIGVLAVEPASTRPRLADRELTYRVFLKIDPDFWVNLAGAVREHWQVETVVMLPLHVHAHGEPLSIQIDPGELTTRSVKVLAARHSGVGLPPL
jgi:hypothetical protein